MIMRHALQQNHAPRPPVQVKSNPEPLQLSFQLEGVSPWPAGAHRTVRFGDLFFKNKREAKVGKGEEFIFGVIGRVPGVA